MNQAEMWAEVVGNLNRAYGQSWTEEGQHEVGRKVGAWEITADRPATPAPVAQETGWKARNAARAAAWEAGRKGR